jgi:hypothetical protein
LLLYVILEYFLFLSDVLEEPVLVLPLCLCHFSSQILDASLGGRRELAFLRFQFGGNDLEEFDLIIDLFEHLVDFVSLGGAFCLDLPRTGLILISKTFCVPFFF